MLEKIYNNRLAERMMSEEVLLGSFHDFVDPSMIELVGACGFDFIVLEHEHGLRDFSDLQSCIRACELSGASPLVRLGDASENFVERLLDGGAAGIIVPHIKTAADAKRAASWARYAPDGVRGTGYRRGPSWIRGPVESQRRQQRNDDVVVFAIIEDPEGVENIEEILQVDGLTGIMPGPFDLALAMGNIQIDDERVVSAMSHVRACVRESEKLLMEFCVNPADTARFIEGGANAVMIGHDAILITDLYRNVANTMREGLPESQREARPVV